MRRGVNARLTSLRSFVCPGGSIMIIIGMFRRARRVIISSTMPWPDRYVSASSRPLSTSS